MVAAVSGERSLRLPGAGAPRFERTASEATTHAAANDRPLPKWEIDHAVRSWLGSLVSRCLELTLMLKRRIPGRPATWLACSRKSKIWRKTRRADGASQQIHQIGPKCNTAYSEWSFGGMLDLSRSKWRSGRYRLMERELFSGRVVDHRLKTRVEPNRRFARV